MTEMKPHMTEKRKYERPTTRVIELQKRTMLLAGSPTYDGFNDEEEW